MDTTIIECSKASAEVVGDNRWTNQMGDGVIINAGDYLSVEGIAINSIGVGGDIIEMPTQITPFKEAQSGAGEYAPNKQSLITGLYIHNDYVNTVAMPLKFQDFGTGTPATNLYNDMVVDGVAGSGAIGNDNYGYILPGLPDQQVPTFPVPATGFANNAPQFNIGGNNFVGDADITNDLTNGGKRFYMITAIDGDGNQLWRTNTEDETVNQLVFQEGTTTTTPQPDLITPQPDLITPQPDLVTPQPDLVENFPAVPESTIIYNSTADGNNALVSDFDVGNNVAPLVLNNGARLFTDDGGLSNDYSTSHSRHITYDAGAGNHIYINPRAFTTEHSSYSMYDRLGITASNTVAGLSTSSGNLDNIKSPLSQYLYQSSSSSPSTIWGSSWVSGNGGYGTGGGWIFPSSDAIDSKGNDNSGWINQWYKIDTRYVRFYFKSDGSATEPGWDILVARAVFTPEVPAYTTTTPQPDLITPQPDLITPQPDLVTPQPDLVTPQPDLVITTPGQNVMMPMFVPGGFKCFAPGTQNDRWDYASTELRFAVNTGYDSPENIANIINKDINETQINYGEYGGPGAPPETIKNTMSGLSTTTDLTDEVVQLQTTKQSVVSIPVNWNGGAPYSSNAYSIAPPTTLPFSSLLLKNGSYNCLFALNPERVISGYNLMSGYTYKVNCPEIYTQTAATTNQEIICCAYPGMPQTGAGLLAKSSWADGMVLPTNIRFEPKNLTTLQRYMTSPANMKYLYQQSTLSPTQYTIDDVLKDTKNFETTLDVGRLIDGQFPNFPFGNTRQGAPPAAPYSQYLRSWIMFQAPATVPSYGAFGNPANPNAPPTTNTFKSYTYFDNDTYNSAVLPPGTPDLNYKIVDSYDDGTGLIINYKNMCSSYNLGIVAIKYDGNLCDELGQHICVGFILKAVNQPTQTQIDLRPFYYGDYCVYDPAFRRLGNQMVKAVSDKEYGDIPVASVPAGGPKTINSRCIQLGANNPTMSFNESIGRFGLSNFYWAKYIGSGESKTGVDDAPNEIITMNSMGGNFSTKGATVTPQQKTPLMLSYAKSGLGIIGFRLYNTTSGLWETIKDDFVFNGSNNANINATDINVKASDWWRNCLLNRIGFDYTDIFPRVGTASNLFQKNTFNKLPSLTLQEPDPVAGDRTILSYFNGGVKPLTLNPYFATTLSTGYSVNNYGEPMFDLEYQRGIGFDYSTVQTAPLVPIAGINIDSATDSQFATNLPQKLSYPYWLVYSDLIGGVEFIGDKGKKGNIMAVANRAYTSGDFAFNFATDYVYQAKKDFVVSQITTEILNPDYSKADIDKGTIILYKIQRNPGGQMENEKVKKVMPPQNKKNGYSK